MSYEYTISSSGTLSIDLGGKHETPELLDLIQNIATLVSVKIEQLKLMDEKHDLEDNRLRAVLALQLLSSAKLHEAIVAVSGASELILGTTSASKLGFPEFEAGNELEASD